MGIRTCRLITSFQLSAISSLARKCRNSKSVSGCAQIRRVRGGATAKSVLHVFPDHRVVRRPGGHRRPGRAPYSGTLYCRRHLPTCLRYAPFIQASLPITNEKRSASFDHLTIAQDTGSAIVGPARADVYWGTGDHAADLAVRLHRLGKFTMLVPSELDPVAAGAHMPLPPEKQAACRGKRRKKKSAAKSSTVLPPPAHLRRTRMGESRSPRIQTRR